MTSDLILILGKIRDLKRQERESDLFWLRFNVFLCSPFKNLVRIIDTRIECYGYKF